MFNIERIKSLPPDSKIRLRRAFGKRLDDVGLENMIAFYSVVPENLTTREAHNLFFVVTMSCYYQGKNDNGKSLSEAVSTYYHLCTESGQKDVLALMDATYDMNGTFLNRMYSLIKKMESKEIYVDANDMYQELKYWDARSKQRKIRIAKSIVGFKEEEE